MVNADWVTSKIMSLISGLKTHTHDASKITSGVIDAARLPDLSASDIKSGVFEVARIPPVALERLVVVADDTARYALTTDTVQSGDTVKVTSSGYMYFVIDEGNLNSDAGYAIYTAGGVDAGQIVSGVLDPARIPASSGVLFLERDCDISLTEPEGGFLVKAFPAISVNTGASGAVSLVADIPAFPSAVLNGDDIYKYIVPPMDTISGSMLYDVVLSIGTSSRSGDGGSSSANATAGTLNTYDSDDVLLNSYPTTAMTLTHDAMSYQSVSQTITGVSFVNVAKIVYSTTVAYVKPYSQALSMSANGYSVYGVRVPAVLK